MNTMSPSSDPGLSADPPEPSALERYTTLAVWIAVLLTSILIPLVVIGLGHLPEDDVLRHAAKAISGKPWSEILVLRSGVTMDEHPGWHATLETLHKMAGFDADGLVAFSIVMLALLVLLSGLFWVRTPEAWIASLLLLSSTTPLVVYRFHMGRPFILWIAVLIFILGMWTSDRLTSGRARLWRYAITLGILTAMAWIHGAWFLFLLPVAGFALAGKFRQAAALALCLVAGTILGAILTGHPLVFLREHVQLLRFALGESRPETALVTEFLPYRDSGHALVLLLPVLAWRAARRQPFAELLKDPVFIVAALGWLLGFRVGRLWTDWGLPAFVLWLARQVPGLPRSPLFTPWHRLGLAIFLCAALFLSMTADLEQRWSRAKPAGRPVPTAPEFPPDWLPGDSGIVYSYDMRRFYELFYKYPRAPWRYILGYEPGLMPPEDYRVFASINTNGFSLEALQPWFDKMTPEDRMVVYSPQRPTIPPLEWKQYGPTVWFGRLPR